MNDTVFLGYDQEALDAQYFLRPLVPDFQDYFDGYAARSAAARAEFSGRLDVAYGPSTGEKLDIFSPAPAADGALPPIHVFIHGGYWQSMDKSDFDYVAQGLVPRGAVAVVVNYDLAPNVGVSEIVRQNRAALAWTWRNAASFGGDPGRIHVSGHSAGGHLTAMMASTDWRAVGDDLPADLVKSGLCISGLFDLEPIQRCYLNEVLGMDADEAQRNSPVKLEPPVAVRQVLAVGGEETDEYHRQTKAYAARLEARGGAVETAFPSGLHHFSIVDEMGQPDSQLMATACALMEIA